MFINKKIIITGLAGLSAIVPAATVMACGDPAKTEDNKTPLVNQEYGKFDKAQEILIKSIEGNENVTAQEEKIKEIISNATLVKSVKLDTETNFTYFDKEDETKQESKESAAVPMPETKGEDQKIIFKGYAHLVNLDESVNLELSKNEILQPVNAGITSYKEILTKENKGKYVIQLLKTITNDGKSDENIKESAHVFKIVENNGEFKYIDPIDLNKNESETIEIKTKKGSGYKLSLVIL